MVINLIKQYLFIRDKKEKGITHHYFGEEEQIEEAKVLPREELLKLGKNNLKSSMLKNSS